jgi:hypothetical protein
LQQLIEHSRSTGQYIRVAVKILTKTHILKDELKEANESKQALLTRNQAMESQLAEESRGKRYVILVALSSGLIMSE